MYVFESHSVLWTQSKKLTFFWIFLSVSTFSSVSAPFSVGLNLFTSSKVETKSRSMNWFKNVLVYLGIRHLQRQQSEMIIIMTAPIIIPEICQTRSPLKTSDSRKLLSWCSLLPVSFPVSPTLWAPQYSYPILITVVYVGPILEDLSEQFPLRTIFHWVMSLSPLSNRFT